MTIVLVLLAIYAAGLYLGIGGLIFYTCELRFGRLQPLALAIWPLGIWEPGFRWLEKRSSK